MLVVTKADLLANPEARAHVETELRAGLRGTPFAEVACVFTSASRGEGLETLTHTLEEVVAAIPPRDASGAVRLPIDRTFTIKGAGCVVTGTLWTGTVAVGQRLTLLPQRASVRVRAIQLHGDDVPTAPAGTRPALNLAGIGAAEIATGSQLVDDAAWTHSTAALAEITLLPSSPPLRRHTGLSALAGTAAAETRCRFLDLPPGQRTVAPGTTATALLTFRAPFVLAFGDVMILRASSGTRTLGAARILDPQPPATLERDRTARLTTATPQDAIAEFARDTGAAGLPERAVRQRIGVPSTQLAPLVVSHHRFWHADAVADARRALVAALPGPGHRVPLATWWRHSPISDPDVLKRLTAEIASVYDLRVHDHMIMTRMLPSSALAPHIVFQVRRALREAGLTRRTPDDLSRELALPAGTIGRALRALVADGVAMRISDRYVLHRRALAGAVRRLSALGSVTEPEARRSLGLSKTAARELFGYLTSLGFMRGLRRSTCPLRHSRAQSTARPGAPPARAARTPRLVVRLRSALPSALNGQGCIPSAARPPYDQLEHGAGPGIRARP